MEPIETTATDVEASPQQGEQMQLDPTEILRAIQESHPDVLVMASQRVYIKKLEAALEAK